MHRPRQREVTNIVDSYKLSTLSIHTMCVLCVSSKQSEQYLNTCSSSKEPTKVRKKLYNLLVRRKDITGAAVCCHVYMDVSLFQQV